MDRRSREMLLLEMLEVTLLHSRTFGSHFLRQVLYCFFFLRRVTDIFVGHAFYCYYFMARFYNVYIVSFLF